MKRRIGKLFLVLLSSTFVVRGQNPPSPPAEGQNRLGGGPQDSMQRSQLPMPNEGHPIPGFGDPFAEREVRRDLPTRTGLIDPDEPTEGLRLLP